MISIKSAAYMIVDMITYSTRLLYPTHNCRSDIAHRVEFVRYWVSTGCIRLVYRIQSLITLPVPQHCFPLHRIRLPASPHSASPLRLCVMQRLRPCRFGSVCLESIIELIPDGTVNSQLKLRYIIPMISSYRSSPHCCLRGCTPQHYPSLLKSPDWVNR